MAALCRLIIDAEPHPGRWNMAVDEALLESAIAGGPITLRWYRWAQPTLSLGYFQPADELNRRPEWNDLAKVRRLTGGGTILHHNEWTYSCVLPTDQTCIKHPYDLYDVIHQAICDWFRESVGIPLAMRGITRHASQEPTLCFLREDSHDVCYGSYKVLGSAQRRRKGALLQHGSLVLRQSAFAPELPGLCELANLPDLTETENQKLAMFVATTLGKPVIPSELSTEEQRLAGELVTTRYARCDQR